MARNSMTVDTSNYKEVVEKFADGKLLVGIDPATARKFFTDSSSRLLIEKTGEGLYIEKAIVWVCFVLDFVSLIFGIIFSLWAIKWYSIIAIPIMILAFFFLGAIASTGKNKSSAAIIGMIIGIVLAYSFHDQGFSMIAWLILVPLPYFFATLTYKLSTLFLRSAAINNEKLFRLLENKAIFLRESK